METFFSLNEQLQASGKKWLIKTYTADLLEFAAGDEARFSRMVDAKGQSSASPTAWLDRIARLAALPAVKHFHGAEIEGFVNQLKLAGFSLPEVKE